MLSLYIAVVQYFIKNNMSMPISGGCWKAFWEMKFKWDEADIQEMFVHQKSRLWLLKKYELKPFYVGIKSIKLWCPLLVSLKISNIFTCYIWIKMPYIVAITDHLSWFFCNFHPNCPVVIQKGKGQGKRSGSIVFSVFPWLLLLSCDQWMKSCKGHNVCLASPYTPPALTSTSPSILCHILSEQG